MLMKAADVSEWWWRVTKNLTSCVIQVEPYLLPSHCDSGNIFFKHWRSIFLFLRHIRNLFDEYILEYWPGEPLTGLLKLFLPLENHLWHKPSKVMSFHSLHLLLSQFWVPLHLSWHHCQSRHHFVPSCLQSSQIGPWRVMPEFKSSRFKWKTLQYVVRLYLKRPSRSEGVLTGMRIWSVITTSCSCRWRRLLLTPPPPNTIFKYCHLATYWMHLCLWITSSLRLFLLPLMHSGWVLDLKHGLRRQCACEIRASKCSTSILKSHLFGSYGVNHVCLCRPAFNLTFCEPDTYFVILCYD